MTRARWAAETPILVASLYPGRSTIGAARAVRVCDTSPGEVLNLTVGGVTLPLYPVLTVESLPSQGMSLDSDPVRMVIDADEIDIADAPQWQAAAPWVELARLWLSPSGAVSSWETREVLAVGQADRVTVDDTGAYVVDLPAVGVTDEGSFYEPDAVLTSQRFADIDSADEYARAPNAAGALPPIPIGPTVHSWRSPLIVVSDMIEGDTTPTYYTPARLLMTYHPLASYGQRSVLFANPKDQRGRYRSGAEYAGSPARATDLLGGTYVYLVHDWAEAAGTDTVTTVSGTSITGAYMQVYGPGDLIRQQGDTDAEWRRVTNVEGGQVEISAAYGSVGGPTDAEALFLPKDQTDAAVIVSGSLGGIAGPRGGVLSNPAEVIEWALRFSRLSCGWCPGDLQALAARLDGLHITNIIRTADVTPWDWCKAKILPLFPILPWYERGRLRLTWIGPIDTGEVVTTFNPTTDAQIRLVSGPDTTPPAWDEVELQYAWDIITQRHHGRVVLSGVPGASVTDPAAQSSPVVIGARWRREGGEQAQALRRRVVQTDAIGDPVTAHAVASWLAWRECRPYLSAQIEAGPSLGWLAAGEAVYFNYPLTPARVVRVEETETGRLITCRTV